MKLPVRIHTHYSKHLVFYTIKDSTQLQMLFKVTDSQKNESQGTEKLG